MSDDPLDALNQSAQQLLWAIAQITQHLARLQERRVHQRLIHSAAVDRRRRSTRDQVTVTGPPGARHPRSGIRAAVGDAITTHPAPDCDAHAVDTAAAASPVQGRSR